MSDRWQVVRIDDLAEVFDGPHATPTKTVDGPWYLSISSLKNGKVDLNESAHLSDDEFPLWTRRVHPQLGDTLFSYETRLGEAGHWLYNGRAAIGRRMGLLRPRRERVDPRFLTYAYIGPQFQSEIMRRAIHGATVDRIPIAEIRKWPIAVPPLEEQRRIAGVLCALDDLIDANHYLRMHLEAARRSIVAEAISRSSIRVRLRDVAEHLPGKYLEKSEYEAGGKYAVFGSNSVMGMHTSHLYEAPLSVLARIGSNCGALALSVEPAWINNNASAIRSKSRADSYWLHGVLEHVDMDRHRGGSGQPFIRVGSLMATDIPWLEKSELVRVERALTELARAEHVLTVESQESSITRDELLPLLMSGRLRVEAVAA